MPKACRIVSRWASYCVVRAMRESLACILLNYFAFTHNLLFQRELFNMIFWRAVSQAVLVENEQNEFRSAIWTSPSIIAGDFAFHMQARTQPRCRPLHHRSRWMHQIFVRLGRSFPRRRSELCQLVRLQICRYRVRSLRCNRFLLIPHRTSPGIAPHS
jgi:hypothetical protein